MLWQFLLSILKRIGSVVVLVDEYDTPTLDNLSNLKRANEMQEVLRSFYTVLNSCDEFLRFVFITGISKFSKMGVFSAMNNLEDISMDRQYGDWLNSASTDMEVTHDELLARLRDYYDGFSFDGRTRLYNPFSILQCLNKGEFRNYWYESGSPSFIVEWMKEHQILTPEEYRHIVINNNDFISAQEIEQAYAPSSMDQSGLLTIAKKNEQLLILHRWK